MCFRRRSKKSSTLRRVRNSESLECLVQAFGMRLSTRCVSFAVLISVSNSHQGLVSNCAHASSKQYCPKTRTYDSYTRMWGCRSSIIREDDFPSDSKLGWVTQYSRRHYARCFPLDVICLYGEHFFDGDRPYT